ncbi:MAG: hydroxymethylglutaryl-CoA reductase, degradative [Chitinophagales bacterium]|nr:hydroxymethylglutaryl-CoA reductase, degradative [Chitinophagales bacterium]MCO5281139.1 hydroxymethylglutaryl-CoA reductase, degradative [Chitinophagales bacterium]OJV30827.1 MAG: hydroxymethylglutaryl-CoA reductase, degradative [Bacteroidetes bacterium 37-13]HRN93599.1 hydroxymethylglutaryl-CoA reductase, degradative [Chitinophagales bacterium]HRP39161.1 hydroxymethylglutaryl-CoA reductase, degradative [Chitinophagales bacterium]
MEQEANENKQVAGFSKLNKRDKIYWLAKNFLYANPVDVFKEFAEYWHDNIEAQKLLDGFSENTLTNFPVPFGLAPNFLINGKIYAIPMVTEESSVVAAASNAAKFWLDRGGFHSKVISTTKVGQVHFQYPGDPEKLFRFFNSIKDELKDGVKKITQNMEKRGGGVLDMELIAFPEEPNYYQIRAYFETVDSMGANFINSCLEEFGKLLREKIQQSVVFNDSEKSVEIIMCILSNYTPECLVRSEVFCKVSELGSFANNTISAEEFAWKFERAVRIACIDSYRATTHNKGIMNGIDSVVIATGNDFRAVESCVHTYACRSGKYTSLSNAKVENGIFKFWIEVPIAIGTVGGLTSLHPLAKRSLELMGNPNAKQLMEIIATVGLAQNFGAIRSLVTTGIQAGHMKMHLTNILAQFQANEQEEAEAKTFFSNKVVSVSAVREFLENLRGKSSIIA